MANPRPWLEALIAVTTSLEANAVRAELKGRDMAVRSIPTGGARAVWNAVGAEERTVAVVMSAAGSESTRVSARFWAPHARLLVSLGSSAGTGLVPVPALLLDGDPGLAARARTALAAADPVVVDGRVGSIDTEAASATARASLAAAGLAAVDGATETWREAGRRLGVPTLAVHALRPDPELAERLERLEPPGAVARSRWRTALALLRHPGDRALLRNADTARRAAAQPAARCAVAACLGPR
ncbi:MAG TPA: hypothetical protein VI316_02450 [Candidatus Dormibacteraeota bacterium]